MSITCTATRVFTTSSIDANSNGWGIVTQNDGSYLAGYCYGTNDFPYPSIGSWLRSSNDGRNWSATGTSDGLIGQLTGYPTNIHKNIIAAPFFLPPTNQAGVMRSINQGFTWSNRLTASIAASPNGRAVFCYGTQSYNKTHALAWGALEGNKTNPPQTWATSSDAGNTWTTHASWDIATPYDACNVIGIAEEGCWIANYTQGQTDPRYMWMANTTDFGATWTVGASLGSTSSPPTGEGKAICCFNKLDAAMAGTNAASPPDGSPGVWWTDDAAASMTLVPSSDIIDWPGGDGNMVGVEVKRITADACFLAFENQNDGTPGSCWRISLDKGHTYEILVEQDGPISTYQIPCGKALITREGALLLMLWQSDDYTTAEVTIWRAPIRCT